MTSVNFLNQQNLIQADQPLCYTGRGGCPHPLMVPPVDVSLPGQELPLGLVGPSNPDLQLPPNS